MKGIILAGDSGTRLHPITLGVPKQLLPIYDKPMIYYPIIILVEAGIKDVLIITTPESEDSFRNCLGDGSWFCANIRYATQDEPKGIAQALVIAEDFVHGDNVCLITGDTIIIGDSLKSHMSKAFKAAEISGNATIFVMHGYENEQYGSIKQEANGKYGEVLCEYANGIICSITGLYVYPRNASERAKQIELSERNLYEIVALNKIYQDEGKLLIQSLGKDCIWFDTNTPDNLLKCSNYMQSHKGTSKN